jgi:hypothetical protein
LSQLAKKSTYCLPKKDSVVFLEQFLRKDYFDNKGFDSLEAFKSQAEHKACQKWLPIPTL